MAERAKRKTVAKLFALQAALLRPELTKADVLVLAVLIEYTSGIYGYAWPSVETIGRVTGLKRRSTQYALRRLEQAGLVATQTGGGRARASRYVVRLDGFDQSPLTDLIKRAATEKAHEPAPFNGGAPDQKGRTDVQKGRTAVRERAHVHAPDPLLTNPSDSIPSVNTASADADAPSDCEHDEQMLGKKLRQLEDWLRETPEQARLTIETWQRLSATADRLDEIANDRRALAYDDTLGNWAQRLAEQIRDRLDADEAVA